MLAEEVSEALHHQVVLDEGLLGDLGLAAVHPRARRSENISEFTKSELLQLNNYKTPIVVIPNPLTLPIKYTPKTFNTECPTILHLGIKANKEYLPIQPGDVESTFADIDELYEQILIKKQNEKGKGKNKIANL